MVSPGNNADPENNATPRNRTKSNPFGSASKKIRKLSEDDVQIGPTVIVTKVKTRGGTPIDGFVVTPKINYADLALVCPMFYPEDPIKKNYIKKLGCIGFAFTTLGEKDKPLILSENKNFAAKSLVWSVNDIDSYGFDDFQSLINTHIAQEIPNNISFLKKQGTTVYLKRNQYPRLRDEDENDPNVFRTVDSWDKVIYNDINDIQGTNMPQLFNLARFLLGTDYKPREYCNDSPVHTYNIFSVGNITLDMARRFKLDIPLLEKIDQENLKREEDQLKKQVINDIALKFYPCFSIATMSPPVQHETDS